MRLGGQQCRLKPDSLAYQMYQKDVITERHRHRYEFNNQYIERLEQAGLRFPANLLMVAWWKSSKSQIILGFWLVNFILNLPRHPEEGIRCFPVL